MILKLVKSGLHKDRLYLHFSDNLILPLFIDDYVKLKLTKGQEVNTDLLSQILHASLTYLLKTYAINQLALSPKTKKILQQKLTRYLDQLLIKYQLQAFQINKHQEIVSTLDYLETNQLINESQYVNYFINKNLTKSRRFLEYNLSQQGVNPLAYAHLFPNQAAEFDNIKALITKKYSSVNLLDYRQKTKVISALYQKGYSLSSIKAVIDDFQKSR